MALEIDDTQIINLASLAQHADELLNNEGVTTTSAGEFDVLAIKGILSNPTIKLFMAYMDKLALLPEKREG